MMTSINDEVFINEKENEKEKKSSTTKTMGQRIFLQRESHRHIMYCGKNLDSKIENNFSGNLYCDILFCNFVLNLR